MSNPTVEYFLPPPPPPPSSCTTPKSFQSRPTSRRPRSSTSESKKAKRSANDVRVNPASTEVISALVSSLSALSVPILDSPSHPDMSPAPSTPIPRWSRRNTADTATLQHTTSPTERFAPIHEAESLGAIIPPAEPSDDVAEPPVVRTSRRPSGMSRMTTSKSSRRRQAFLEDENRAHSMPATPRPIMTPLRSPPILETIARPLSPNNSTRRKTISARPLQEDKTYKRLDLSQRGSLVGLRTRYSKGKERAREISPPKFTSPAAIAPPRSASSNKPFSSANIYAPERKPLSHPVHHPSSRQVIGDDTGFVVAESSSSGKWFSGKKEGRSSRVLSESPSSPNSPFTSEGRRFIPTRSSSLRQSSASSPSSLFSSRRSSRRLRSPEPQRKESIRETGESINLDGQPLSEDLDLGSGVPPNDSRTVKDDLETGGDDKVLRRINQLRTAMDERDRNQLSDLLTPPWDSSRSPSRSPGAFLPFRQLPSNSVYLNQRPMVSVHANSIPVQHMEQEKEDIPKAPTLKSSQKRDPTVSAVVPTFLNFSRPKASFFRSPSASGSQASVDVPSVEQSPVASRSSSRAKRWSNPDIHGSDSPIRRDLSRNRSSYTQYPTLVEERRSSFDSVKESVENFLGSPRLSQTIPAPENDRTISFAEVGDPDGFAVFCCVGMGLTRYVMAFYEELATTLKLRLITPERPGVGESTALEEQKSPLYWPDDIQAICKHLSIQKFSLLAHSAGAIYALATALKMPTRIHGKIHLLAPWIPPSQLSTFIGSPSPSVQARMLPRSQRLLRLMPTPLLKLTNSGFLGGVARGSNKSSSRSRKSNDHNSSPRPSTSQKGFQRPSFMTKRNQSDERQIKLPSTPRLEDIPVPSDHSIAAAVLSVGSTNTTVLPHTPNRNTKSLADRQRRYDENLTPAVWDLATKGANPAVDLIVCLERHRSIGFRYADVLREVVIYHGTKDTRVPLENVRSLAKAMQKAELKELEGEEHGLMANASVMAQVLTDLGRECEMGVNGLLNDPHNIGTMGYDSKRSSYTL